MTEIQLFHCPNCGAPLDLPESAASVRCPYCNSSVIVPGDLRDAIGDEGSEPSSGAYQINLGDVRLMIANGKKLDAVNLIIAQTGLGLREAKDVADAIERQEEIGPLLMGQGATIRAEVTTLDQSELMDLVRQGKKIEAIKQVREQTGLGLKESKDFVEALERGDALAMANAFSGGMFSTTEPGAGTTVVMTTAQMDEGSSGPSPRRLAKAGGLAGCGLVALVFFILAVTVIPILFAFTVGGGPLASLWSQVNPVSFARADLTLEGEGIGPGQFDDPRAVAADREGNIYAADYDTGRLQSFDPEGRFRWLVNLGEETIIESLDIGNGNVLYVTAQGILRRFEPTTGTELTPFPDPDRSYYFEDLAVTPDGRIALVYGGENLLILNDDLEPVLEIPQAVSSVTNDSELDGNVDTDPLGNLFILGTFNNLVLKYSPDGRYINQFGGTADGQEDGKFQAVGDLAVDMEGRVYVSDINGIQVFEGDGRFIERFTPVRYAHGLNFDLENQMYIASNEPQVVRLVLRD